MMPITPTATRIIPTSIIVGNLVTIVPEKKPEEADELTSLELEAVWFAVLEELVTLLLEEELEAALLVLDEVVLLEVLEPVSDPI